MNFTLHIITNCADRKRVSVPAELHLRAIPFNDNGNIATRAHLWWSRLTNPSTKEIQQTPAIDLYAGEYWAAVRRLLLFAGQTRFHPHLWISSAGYGLISPDTFLHPYSATFTNSDPDTVAFPINNKQSHKSSLQTWWNRLCTFDGLMPKTPRSLSKLTKKSNNDYFLILASPNYLMAMEQDLTKAIANLAKPDRLIIISSRGHVISNSLSKYIAPYNARLQSYVGGTRGSLQARIAAMILQNIEPRHFKVETVRKLLENLILSSPELPRYNRSRLDDHNIQEFIRQKLSNSPQLSCSKLLRCLRDTGQACEQSRFKKLYWQIRDDEHEA